jgi:SAM-dependent methyltransferase
LSFNNNLEEQERLDGGYAELDVVELMRAQRKYDQVLPRIPEGAKILDIACGAGELQEFLKERLKDFKYSGVDYDARRVAIGKSLGRNVEQLDASNLEALTAYLEAHGPFDYIFCIYSFYFFPVPEAFLQRLHDHTKKVILGGFNGGHWSYRLRLLLGRAPAPALHYSTRQTNYEEMKRFWTLRDHRFLFESLRYKYKMISIKSDATSLHYTPHWWQFPSLTAKAFIFELEPFR